MTKKPLAILLMLSALATCLVGCSTNPKDEEVVPTDPKKLFEEGVGDINQGNYKTAATTFESLEKEHPASNFAPEATVRRAYAQYLNNDFDDAIITIDDFVKQYPVHESIAYMYYLRALCYYDQIVDTGRDQQLTDKAIEALREVVARFPDTTYARDARLKADFAFNNLAGKEMEIANFYQKKNHFIAALARYKTIVEQYQTSIFTPEALYRMVEIFVTLGDEAQAKKYAAVLGQNYPNSEWYEKSYSIIVDRNYGDKRPWYRDLEDIW